MVEIGSNHEAGDLYRAYLPLAQRILREVVARAMFRLGISEELAVLLGNLSLSQIVKLAASSSLLCRFRLMAIRSFRPFRMRGREAASSKHIRQSCCRTRNWKRPDDVPA